MNSRIYLTHIIQILFLGPDNLLVVILVVVAVVMAGVKLAKVIVVLSLAKDAGVLHLAIL